MLRNQYTTIERQNAALVRANNAMTELMQSSDRLMKVCKETGA